MARCDRMTRRMFAACIIAAAVPGVSGAQQVNKKWRVGLVHVGLDHVPPSLEPLRQELRARGYEEGKNLQLDFRNVADERALSDVVITRIHAIEGVEETDTHIVAET